MAKAKCRKQPKRDKLNPKKLNSTIGIIKIVRRKQP